MFRNLKYRLPAALGLLLSLAAAAQNFNNSGSYASHKMAFPVDPASLPGVDVSGMNLDAELFYEDRVSSNPKDAAAWLNYYKAVRFRADAMDKESQFRSRLDSIDGQMGREVPGSFEQQYVHYWNGNHDLSRSASLKAAYALRPNDPGVLRQMTGYELISGNRTNAAGYVAKWEKTGDMPSSLLPYAYNVLQSVPQDAILITSGEFDTYPLVQQQMKGGVRADVQLLCVDLCSRSANRALIFRNLGLKLPDNDSVSAFTATYVRRVAAANPSKKIYLASTLGPGMLSVLQNELYLTGLAFRYSATPIDNLAFLRDNVGMKMNLETVGLSTLSSSTFDNGSSQQLQMNYVLPLVLAAQQYEAGGDKDKAEMLRAKARQVGANAGRQKEVDKLLGH